MHFASLRPQHGAQQKLVSFRSEEKHLADQSTFTYLGHIRGQSAAFSTRKSRRLSARNPLWVGSKMHCLGGSCLTKSGVQQYTSPVVSLYGTSAKAHRNLGYRPREGNHLQFLAPSSPSSRGKLTDRKHSKLKTLLQPFSFEAHGSSMRRCNGLDAAGSL